MAVGFPEGHERLCALEWLLQRMATHHCLKQPDPKAAAAELFNAGDEYGMAMIGAASGNIDHVMTAVSISASIKMLLEPIVEDVNAAT